MMRSVNRKTTLNNNRHNQLVVTRQKWSEPDIILVEGFFYFFSYLCVGWGCQILTPSPFNLSCCCCSFSPFCLSPSLSQSLSLPTLRSRLLGFLAEHRDRRKKKKKNRRSNLWRTSLLKCATFYFSANYPHAVRRLKAELWLSLSARLRPWHVVLSECHSNRGTQWSSVLILNNFCSFFFFFFTF